MKTDDLIAALAADTKRPGPSPMLAQSGALAIGGLASSIVMLSVIGARTDLEVALTSWRFDLKLALVASALVLAFIDCVRLTSPAATGWASRVSLFIPALLISAVAVELVVVPSGRWGERLVGTNALVCLTVIPALSLAPLILGLVAMRTAAPSSATAAGVAVGRLAAAVAATLYALHCFDDSPLFVAVWYPLAMLPVIAIGAIAGRSFLRW